jgi:hypothetical protein
VRISTIGFAENRQALTDGGYRIGKILITASHKASQYLQTSGVVANVVGARVLPPQLLAY